MSTFSKLKAPCQRDVAERALSEITTLLGYVLVINLNMRSRGKSDYIPGAP